MSKNARVFSFIEITGIIILVLAIIAAILIFVITLSDLPFAKLPEDFGIFGDYIGGLVGTLVGLISIIFLYRTYKLQLDITLNKNRNKKHSNLKTLFLHYYYNKGTFYKISKESLLVMTVTYTFNPEQNL